MFNTKRRDKAKKIKHLTSKKSVAKKLRRKGIKKYNRSKKNKKGGMEEGKRDRRHLALNDEPEDKNNWIYYKPDWQITIQVRTTLDENEIISLDVNKNKSID